MLWLRHPHGAVRLAAAARCCLTDQALYRSLVDRVTQRGDAVIGVPPNLANWSIGYDAVLLYADTLRRSGITGSTDPKSARAVIKDEFTRLKSFEDVYKYKINDNGDGYIPGNILRADVDRKAWTFVR